MSKCGSYNTHFVVFFYKHRMHITFEAVCRKAENKAFYFSNKLRNFCPFRQKRRDLSHAVFSLSILFPFLILLSVAAGVFPRLLFILHPSECLRVFKKLFGKLFVCRTMEHTPLPVARACSRCIQPCRA